MTSKEYENIIEQQKEIIKQQKWIIDILTTKIIVVNNVKIPDELIKDTLENPIKFNIG